MGERRGYADLVDKAARQIGADYSCSAIYINDAGYLNNMSQPKMKLVLQYISTNLPLAAGVRSLEASRFKQVNLGPVVTKFDKRDYPFCEISGFFVSDTHLVANISVVWGPIYGNIYWVVYNRERNGEIRKAGELPAGGL
jgi:hypothetical protein